MRPKQTKRATGTVGEGAAGKKAKATQHAGGQSVSEKSQATRTSKNVFEKSNSKTQYFVREVKGRRMTKNGVEFLIGWRDFPLDKDDTWEPITNLPGSEHMIAEFQRNWEEQYKIQTSFLLHHYLTLAPNLSASVTTNTSPHRGNARVTVFLAMEFKKLLQ